VADDRLAAATAELYGAAPEAFTGRRGELAAAAREAGDRAAAKAIAALRRPTRAAWVVNRLARADPGAPQKLAELAAALRAAQEAGHGPRLRELSAARAALVDALTAQALTAADVADPPPSLRLEVSQTLTAALADPGVAAAFAAGTLTRAVQWSGFGVLPADTEPGEETEPEDTEPEGTEPGEDTAPDEKAEPDAKPEPDKAGGAPRAAGRREAATGKTDGARRGGPVSTTAPGTAGPGQPAEKGAAARPAQAGDRLARDAAERAAQRREQRAEAERVVADASAATAAAEAAEDRLEAEVRDLEQRLTRARSDLSAARTRARRAEAAERRARQALDRLPGE
jgi:hypothetical protein